MFDKTRRRFESLESQGKYIEERLDKKYWELKHSIMRLEAYLGVVEKTTHVVEYVKVKDK